MSFILDGFSLKGAVGETFQGRKGTPEAPHLVWAAFWTQQKEQTVAAGSFNFNNASQKAGIAMRKRNSVITRPATPSPTDSAGLSSANLPQSSHLPCKAVRLEPFRVMTSCRPSQKSLLAVIISFTVSAYSRTAS